MKQLVFATHNPNKLKEIQKILAPDLKLLSLDDINCYEDIAETASTIEGNARLKAAYVFKNYNIACFADDTGLEVEALDGKPGVKSARYAGEAKNSEANTQKLLQHLSPHTNRKARFKTVIHLMSHDNDHSFTGICPGTITKEKRGKGGFGYDPIFKPDGYEHTFAELDLSVKNKISHRALAVQKLVDFLK
ncbi:MAG: non-canonical purine NTP diphosphatase [Psychroflexus sp.]|nr:non-canonical purine NTP diphosphatase [Psychroflexus sp.]